MLISIINLMNLWRIMSPIDKQMTVNAAKTVVVTVKFYKK